MEKWYRIFKSSERYGVVFTASLLGLGTILSSSNLSGVYDIIEILCWLFAMLYILASGVFGLYGMKYFEGKKFRKYLKYASYIFMIVSFIFMFNALIQYIKVKKFI